MLTMLALLDHTGGRVLVLPDCRGGWLVVAVHVEQLQLRGIEAPRQRPRGLPHELEAEPRVVLAQGDQLRGPDRDRLCRLQDPGGGCHLDPTQDRRPAQQLARADGLEYAAGEAEIEGHRARDHQIDVRVALALPEQHGPGAELPQVRERRKRLEVLILDVVEERHPAQRRHDLFRVVHRNCRGGGPGLQPRGEAAPSYYVVLDFHPPALSPIVSGTTTIALATLSESQRFPRNDRILRAVFPDGPVSGPASRDRSGRLSVSGGMRRRPQDDRCSRRQRWPSTTSRNRRSSSGREDSRSGLRSATGPQAPASTANSRTEGGRRPSTSAISSAIARSSPCVDPEPSNSGRSSGQVKTTTDPGARPARQASTTIRAEQPSRWSSRPSGWATATASTPGPADSARSSTSRQPTRSSPWGLPTPTTRTPRPISGISLVNGHPTLEHARTRRLRRCTAQACTALIVQHSPVGWKKNLIVTDFGCIYRRPHVHSQIRWPQVLFQSKEPLFEGQTDLSPQNP